MHVLLMPLRLLAAHWPALLAWFLAGILARYALIEIAGTVGAFTTIGGILILALAVLARLISFVAMFLTLRDGMAHLGALAPIPPDPRERRRAFGNALMVGILPFIAIYTAWGYIADDLDAYAERALSVRTGEIANGRWTAEDLPAILPFNAITISILIASFAARWAWKRYRDRLPVWLTPAAVYCEMVWIFFSVLFLRDVLDGVGAWVDQRQAMVWLADVRAWAGEFLVPLAWVWEAVEWVLGEVGGLVLEPLAWLTVAGVIYGQAVATQAPKLSGRVVERARTRYGRIPAVVRRRVNDVWSDFAGRFAPIQRTLVLMWRAGPILIGGYVLAYTVLGWLEVVMTYGLTRVIGPQAYYLFWMVADTLVFLLVPLLLEPVRITIIATAYDRTIARLVPAAPAPDAPAPDSAVELEVQRDAGQSRDGVAGSDLDVQRP